MKEIGDTLERYSKLLGLSFNSSELSDRESLLSAVMESKAKSWEWVREQPHIQQAKLFRMKAEGVDSALINQQRAVFCYTILCVEDFKRDWYKVGYQLRIVQALNSGDLDKANGVLECLNADVFVQMEPKADARILTGY